MRIGIDLRSLEEENISGVGEYTLEIIRCLLEADRKNDYIIFSNAFRNQNENFSFIDEYSNVKLARFRFPNKLLNLFLWYLNWPKLDKLIGGVDVFFAPNINFLTVSRNCKFVTTFHDLSFEYFPEFFRHKTMLWHSWFVNPRKIARNSDSVIAVSKSTKTDLENIYGISPEKVRVVRHGVGEEYRIIDRNDPKLLEIQKKYGLPYKYILYLGNIEPRKNIVSIIEAFKDFQKVNAQFGRCKLVFAGNISRQYTDIFNREKNGIFSIGYVAKDDKPFLYNLASLFVYPSHFEGFGLPVLEAMACGTPVITSHNSSIPQVAGKSAIAIDPNRPEQLREAMKSILGDEKLQTTLRQRGLEQARKFSWRKCANETLKILTN